MKHERKLTRGQKIVLARNGLDSGDFFVIKNIGCGWLFRSKSDPDRFVVCYPSKNGVFEADGTTPAGGAP